MGRYSDNGGIIHRLGPNAEKPEGYKLVAPGLPTLYVVGSYENVCGGCDGIKTQDEICNKVREYAKLGHVIYEGLLVSTVFSRYADLAASMQPVRTVFAFLDTPLDVCVTRINARREERAEKNGNIVKLLDPKKTQDKWETMRRVYNKFQVAGCESIWVDHTEPTRQILELLTGAPND
jgi:hypothetical protein